MVDIDSTVLKKAGHQPGQPKTGGRKAGTPNRLSQRALLDLARLKGDPPHIALLKIGRDEQQPIAIRVSALGFCAPFFQPRLAPRPLYVDPPVSIGELKDTCSVTEAAARVIAKTSSGELDLESGKFLLEAIGTFAKLYESQVLEMRVMALEEQLRAANSTRTPIEGPLLQVVGE
jgi:hypothetical protein